MHDNSLHIDLGQDLPSNEIVSISEKGLYQNMLITGAIGSGKTSSAMYPITRQLIAYKSSNLHEKLGMLILDVKEIIFTKLKIMQNSIIVKKI